MIDHVVAISIKQKKLDALCAKLHHVENLGRFNRNCMIVDGLALSVPVAYFVFRLFAKGTKAEWIIEGIWELLAATLLVLTIIKMVARWQERAQKHSKLLGENIFLVGQADSLLSDLAGSSRESATYFLREADRIEAEDMEAIGTVEEIKRREVYRKALTESEPGNPDITCPVCHSSPWRYTPGSCQTCGNTPTKPDITRREEK